MLVGEGESKEEWKRRVIRGTVTLTLGVNDVPIRLVRREN